MSKEVTTIFIALAVLLIAILGVGFLLIVRDAGQTAAPALTPTAPATQVAAGPASSSTPLTLPAPAVTLLPTATPPPTITPSPTPAATATPTESPTPPATATAVRPTFAPPTRTPAPPPTPDSHGLVGAHYALQARSSYVVNGSIWFEFVVSNVSGAPVVYDSLGTMPRKDGVDRPDMYQHSYDGTVAVNGLSWEDHIELTEPGNYTLRLVICFTARDSCLSGATPFVTLSQEIPVTIP